MYDEFDWHFWKQSCSFEWFEIILQDSWPCHHISLDEYGKYQPGKLKDKDYCLIEIIKGLTDKGQFQYLTKLMGPQEGTYLYATQFHSLR